MLREGESRESRQGIRRREMNFASARNMQKHLKMNMPGMAGFQVANIYMMGSVLSGETTGKLLAGLAVSCWENKKAPVFVLEDTVLRSSVTDEFGRITSEYAYNTGEAGIYFANVGDRDTKERIVAAANGAYRIWFISLNEKE